jgi:hypothetical protein
MFRKIGRAINILILSISAVVAQDAGSQLALPEGDFNEGLKAFVDLACHQCHTVPGVMLPVYDGNSPVTLTLGANTLSVKTYAELVTSIINPNHVIASRYLDKLGMDERGQVSTLMPFKEEMTVRQLLDLVTFLDVRYASGLEYYKAYQSYFDVLP